MRWTLVIAALLWPILLGVALVDRLDDHPTWAGTILYMGASHICHQRPERSFFLDGHQWPVCGRCSGLYLAAPVGASWAVRRRRWSARSIRIVLALAALPTLVTMVAEWALAVPVSSAVRAVAALPLGAAIAAVIVHASARSASVDRIN